MSNNQVSNPYFDSDFQQYDMYVDYYVSTTLPYSIYYSLWPLNNNSSLTLYYQLVCTVVLASGSTAVIAGKTINLGSMTSGESGGDYLSQAIASVTTNPSVDEVETLNIVLKRYTDSGYSVLYDTATMTSINLHMFSSNTNTLISKDNFASASLDSWSLSGTKGYLNTTTTVYYDASSGYAMDYHVFYPNGDTYPATTDIKVSKTVDIASTYSDAIAEIFFKNYYGAGQIGIGVVNSNGTFNYMAQSLNKTNWFYTAVHLNPNDSNEIYFAMWKTGIGGVTIPIQLGNGATNNPGASIGLVNYLGKTSGVF